MRKHSSVFLCREPFVFDPFNAGNLIRLKKLDSREIAEQIAERRFGAIQTDSPVDTYRTFHVGFSDDILDAISRFYEIGRREGTVIYVPRPDRANTARGQ